jgi:hypothetical protein
VTTWQPCSRVSVKASKTERLDAMARHPSFLWSADEHELATQNGTPRDAKW